jgi:3-oxoacyl-[acyl-carrier-protein] synthase II
LPQELALETGVAIGGGSGVLLEAENFYKELLKTNGRHARFSSLSTIYCASSADRITSNLKLYTPKATFMTACSAGATALGYARDMIQNDQAQMVLAAAWNLCAG